MFSVPVNESNNKGFFSVYYQSTLRYVDNLRRSVRIGPKTFNIGTKITLLLITSVFLPQSPLDL